MKRFLTPFATFVAFAATLAACISQPVFISQPQDYSVSLGVDVFLYAPAYGTTPVSYQWFKNGSALPGQCMEILMLSPLRTDDAGSYFVIAQNGSGSVTSRVAHVSVDGAFYKISTGPIVEDAGQAWSGVWADYDQDGFQDLFVTHEGGQGNTLFRNNGNGSFTLKTEACMPFNRGISFGAAWGDVNNDGFPDLAVANFNGENDFLFINNTNGSFSRVTNNLVATDQDNTFGISWTDADGDGWLDLYAANYGGVGTGGTNRLCRNNQDGTFSLLHSGPGFEQNTYITGCSWADYDNDLKPDLFLTRLGNQPNFLYRNLGSNRFALEMSSPIGTDAVHSMGAAWADYDNDGWLDLLVPTGTPFVSSHSPLFYHNNGNGTFTRVTNTPITAASGRMAGAAWGDYDNDGWQDLYLSFANQPNTLYHNLGGTNFEQILTGSIPSDTGDTRGCSWVDYNNDGFLDLFAAGFDRGNLLYRNAGNSNAWLKVNCAGRFSNRLGIGAKVRVQVEMGTNTLWLMREINGGSTLCSQPLQAVFGLGSATVAQIVRVEWPSGAVQELFDIPARQTLTITEPEMSVAPQNPGAVLGSPFTFSPVGMDLADVVCQWFFNDQPLQDETNIALVLPSVQTNLLGQYSVWVRDTAGSFSHRTPPQTLRWAIKPYMTNQPAPATNSVSLGAVVQYRCGIGGTGPLLSQWQFNGQDIPGATNPVLTLPCVSLADAGRYQLFARNLGGAVTSLVVSLHVDGTFTKMVSGSLVSDGGSSYGVALLPMNGSSGLFFANSGGQNNFLYRPNESGMFDRVLTQMPFTTDRGDAVGAAVGDYDNDGNADLFVANMNMRQSLLYRGLPDGSLLKILTGEPVETRGNCYSAAWGDADRDGFLDLFVSSFGADHFFHNNGDGTFSRTTNCPMALDANYSRGTTWVDYDNDGNPDLFTLNSGTTNNLYKNLGGGVFEKVTTGRLVTDVGGGNGCAWGDYDNDGDLDLHIAKGGADFLYKNNGDGTFDRITGINVVTDGGASWASTWLDFDSDGWLDLLVANNGAEFLYKNLANGSFARVSTGSIVTDGGDTRGCLASDLNNDGFIDVVLANFNQNNSVYFNSGNSNSWLKVRCEGTRSNRMGLGAKVRIRATLGGREFWQMRELTSGDGLGSQMIEAHFGLGDAMEVSELRVEWPSGQIQTLASISANQSLMITEPPPFSFTRPALSNGVVGFRLSANPGAVCQIEASTNFHTWTSWLTLTNLSTNTWLECPISPEGHRFFRARTSGSN